MSEVTITVRGEHQVSTAPERATIRLSVRTEGSDRTDVVERLMALAEPVRTSLTDRKGAGTLVDWSSTRLAVRAERPWNSEGRRLAPVFYASIDFTATFTEASELSLWVTDVSVWEGVEVGWVDWHLTPGTRARIEQEVAAAAVGVAVNRAEAYASALGLAEVIPTAIADSGLISPEPVFAAPRMLMKAESDMGGAMEYEPEEIVVSATVEARFVAR